MVGAASGGGGRQLRVWGGCTRRRGARGVVESVGEMLERAVDGGTVGGRKVEEEERVLHGGGGRPLQPLEAVDGRGGESVGGKTTATRPWARTRR
jgi:hypothetical protein